MEIRFLLKESIIRGFVSSMNLIFNEFSDSPPLTRIQKRNFFSKTFRCWCQGVNSARGSWKDLGFDSYGKAMKIPLLMIRSALVIMHLLHAQMNERYIDCFEASWLNFISPPGLAVLVTMLNPDECKFTVQDIIRFGVLYPLHVVVEKEVICARTDINDRVFSHAFRRIGSKGQCSGSVGEITFSKPAILEMEYALQEAKNMNIEEKASSDTKWLLCSSRTILGLRKVLLEGRDENIIDELNFLVVNPRLKNFCSVAKLFSEEVNVHPLYTAEIKLLASEVLDRQWKTNILSFLDDDPDVHGSRACIIVDDTDFSGAQELMEQEASLVATSSDSKELHRIVLSVILLRVSCKNSLRNTSKNTSYWVVYQLDATSGNDKVAAMLECVRNAAMGVLDIVKNSDILSKKINSKLAKEARLCLDYVSYNRLTSELRAALDCDALAFNCHGLVVASEFREYLEYCLTNVLSLCNNGMWAKDEDYARYMVELASKLIHILVSLEKEGLICPDSDLLEPLLREINSFLDDCQVVFQKFEECEMQVPQGLIRQRNALQYSLKERVTIMKLREIIADDQMSINFTDDSQSVVLETLRTFTTRGCITRVIATLHLQMRKATMENRWRDARGFATMLLSGALQQECNQSEASAVRVKVLAIELERSLAQSFLFLTPPLQPGWSTSLNFGFSSENLSTSSLSDCILAAKNCQKLPKYSGLQGMIEVGGKVLDMVNAFRGCGAIKPHYSNEKESFEADNASELVLESATDLQRTLEVAAVHENLKDFVSLLSSSLKFERQIRLLEASCINTFCNLSPAIDALEVLGSLRLAKDLDEPRTSHDNVELFLGHERVNDLNSRINDLEKHPDGSRSRFPSGFLWRWW